jgi:DNA-directed RNA polymerase subunit RPC12/RpoP
VSRGRQFVVASHIRALHREERGAMGASVGFRFISIPGHRVVNHPQVLGADERLEPEMPPLKEAVERAFASAEFRDVRAKDRVRALLQGDRPPALGSPGKGFGPSALFAQPPQDLPALLRLADELEELARQEAGERALVWKCGDCGARYAVPVALVRPVSIRCERCGHPVELNPQRSLAEESLIDPFLGSVNTCRRELAAFFREAMARGWPVLVAAEEVSPDS